MTNYRILTSAICNELREPITSTYEDNCKISTGKSNSNTPVEQRPFGRAKNRKEAFSLRLCRQRPIGSLKTAAEVYTTMGNYTLEELLKIHFPKSTIIPAPMGGWVGP